MTQRRDPVDWHRLRRRLRYAVVLLLPGMLANALALTAPAAAPALLGNAAMLALALRLPLPWVLLSALPLGGVTGEWRWLVYTLLSGVWLWWVKRRALGWPKTLAGWSLPLPFLAWGLLPPELQSAGDQLLGVLVLVLGSLASLALAAMVDRLAVRGRQRPLSPLADLLSARVTLVVLGPVILLLLGGLQSLWQSRANESAARLQAAARDFATETLLYVVSQRDIIDYAAADTLLPAQLPNLAGLHAAFPGFLTLLVSDAAGKIVFYHAPAHQGFGGKVDDRAYFQVPRQHGGHYVSDVFRGRGFGTDLLVAISAAHRNADGDFGGVVQGALSLSYLSERLRSKASSGALQFAVLDRAGKLVANSPAFPEGQPVEDILALQPGPQLRGLQLDGLGTSLWQEQAIAPLGWRLVAIDGIAALRREAMTAALLLAAACLLLIELLRRHAHRFTRPLSGPLQNLLTHVRQIDLNDAASLTPLPHRSHSVEFAELHDDFNAMQARLVELSTALQGALAKQERLNRELEQRVDERTRELREALAEAERLARAKSEFLANMSHELRTPLTAILGYAERALRSPADALGGQAALDVIDRNGRHLLGVVNDILDASRIDAGQMQLERLPVPLLPLLQDVFALFEGVARARGLAFSFDLAWPLPETVPADPQRLRQAMINLVGNAIKFTETGTVRLRARASAEAGLLIAIEDSGIGITAAQQQRLFRAFEQADASTSRRFGGSGLGLHLSQAFIQAMGGRIEVESTPAVGSCFSIRLPLGAEVAWLWKLPERASALPGAALPRLRGHVLVVDDVDDLRRLMAELVSAAGVAVSTAANGLQALERVQARAPDLILMDMHMPVMDGAEAVSRMRAGGFAGVVVALTADVLPEHTARFLALGCDETLAKPVDQALLYALLARRLPGRASGTGKSVPGSALEALRQRYRQRLRDEAEQLQEHDMAGDETALRRLLHTIKGSAGTFGLPAISVLAAAAEQAFEDGARSAWEPARDALIEAMHEAGDTAAASPAEG